METFGPNTLTFTSRKTDAAGALRPLDRKDFVPGARTVEPTQHDKLTAQAQKWVAQTFFGVMLKQMRESPFKSELFSGGRGGQAFGSMMDQHLADRMSRAAGQQLVQSIVKKFEASAGRGQPGKPAPKPQAATDQYEPAQAAPTEKNPSGYDFSKVRIHVAPALRG